MTHKIREGIEEFAKELSEKVRYYAGKGQYPNDQVIQKAYLDGVETAIGMMYIDLTGTPKSEGMLAKFLHQELQKAREEERDRILNNILKWSTTATVTETTGREGAKRATTKLRASLAGCYHFLYQALRINQSELDQPNK